MWCHLGDLLCACFPFVCTTHFILVQSLAALLVAFGCVGQVVPRSFASGSAVASSWASQHTLVTTHCHCTLPFNRWHYVLSLDWLCCWHSVIHGLILISCPTSWISGTCSCFGSLLQSSWVLAFAPGCLYSFFSAVRYPLYTFPSLCWGHGLLADLVLVSARIGA